MVGKMRWGDSAELDDDGDFDMSAALPASQVSAAPDHEPPRASLFAARRGEAQTLTAPRTFSQPRQVIGPDANGVKTYIDYSVKDDGLKVRDQTSPPRPNPSGATQTFFHPPTHPKTPPLLRALPRTKNSSLASLTRPRSIRPSVQVRTVKKVRVHTETKKVTPAMAARKKWAKFGDAQRYKPGDESMTAVSIEEIFLERYRATPKSESEKQGDELAKMASSNTSLLVCRICGKKGDHWTTKCPYKDLASMNTLGLGDSKPPGDDDGPSGKGPGKGGYVPPSMRAGASSGASMGESMNRRREENSVRVSNLSEDTREQDLQELFRPFGPVTRIYVAFNRETGESRGFAFVNFVNRDDAQRAINKLDGYGYDNLILRVEWAAPREERK